MPIYEYVCPECGYEREIIQSMDAKPPGCPRCSNFPNIVFMKKQLGACLVYFGRRNSYTRKGYSNSNVVLSGSDGYRVMEQSRMKPGQTRLDRQLNTSRGKPQFATDNK